MELVTDLTQYRPSLAELLRGVRRKPYDEDEARGLLAEALVEDWLRNCPHVTFEAMPRANERYALTHGKDTHTVTAQDLYTRQSRHEFDFLIRYKQQLVGIEVKSGRANGAFGKAARGLSILRDVYHEDPWYAVICPANMWLEHREQRAPIVWLDIGYSKHELYAAMRNGRLIPPLRAA